jgi:Zn finger protein HypA/HybF involved in hydrogenase expression
MTLHEFLSGVLEDQPFTIVESDALLRCSRCDGYWTVNGQTEDWQECPHCRKKEVQPC